MLHTGQLDRSWPTSRHSVQVAKAKCPYYPGFSGWQELLVCHLALGSAELNAHCSLPPQRPTQLIPRLTPGYWLISPSNWALCSSPLQTSECLGATLPRSPSLISGWRSLWSSSGTHRAPGTPFLPISHQLRQSSLWSLHCALGKPVHQLLSEGEEACCWSTNAQTAWRACLAQQNCLSGNAGGWKDLRSASPNRPEASDKFSKQNI